MQGTAEDIIAYLDLKPHPEGGWYKETWRAPVEAGARGAGSAILYLLAAGQVSHWHRIDAAELWLHQAGAPLLLSLAVENRIQHHRLGSDLLGGDAPQALVEPGQWQSARVEGGWALVACIVVPAFQFSGFELAPPGWTPYAT